MTGRTAGYDLSLEQMRARKNVLRALNEAVFQLEQNRENLAYSDFDAHGGNHAHRRPLNNPPLV